jgi:L-aminopeptidase/D-esterase-like protein
VGGAALRGDALIVGALFAVNAFGQLLDSGGPPPPWPVPPPSDPLGPDGPGWALSSTTIGVVATNARLGKGHCLLVAQSAHDGMARALEPVHTRYDGDAVVAAATGAVDAPLEQVRLLAARVTTLSIRAALDETSSGGTSGPGGTIR